MKYINDVKVIYREDDDGLEIENIIFEKILKKGVWVLYGKKDGIYECLNVGKSINVGSEILYDVACLKFLEYEENSRSPAGLVSGTSPCGARSIF